MEFLRNIFLITVCIHIIVSLEVTTATAIRETTINVAIGGVEYKNTNSVYAGVEQQFICDLIQGSIHTKDLNYIFIGITPHTSCGNATHEIYASSDLKSWMETRGTKLKTRFQDLYTPHLEQLRNINAGSSNRDVILLKFIDFTAREENILSVVREHNMKSYIVILTVNDYVYLMTKKNIVRNTFYNIYLVRIGRRDTVYTLYETCAYCKAGHTDFMLYNVWKLGEGFEKPVRYESSFKGQFFGAFLKVGYQPFPPSFFINSNGSVGRGGSDYWILETLATSLNFKSDLTLPEDGQVCRNKQGILVGYCKMLISKEVDIAGLPGTLAWERFQYMHPTAAYYMASPVLVSANPPMDTKLSSPVDPYTLVMIPFSYLIYYHMHWTIGKFWYGDPTISYVNSAFLFFSIVNLEGVKMRKLKSSHMLIIGIWMITSFSIISRVFGEMTSIKSIPIESRRAINSLEDMVINKMSLLTAPYHNLDVLLPPGDTRIQFLKSTKKLIGIKEGLKSVLDNPEDFSYLFWKDITDPIIRHNYWDGRKRNPFHFSGAVGRMIHVTILLRKDAPYRDDFTKKLLQMEAAGLIRQKWLPEAKEWFGKFSLTSEKTDDTERFKALGLMKFKVALIIWSISLLFSSMVFIAEMFYEQIKMRILWKKKAHDQETQSKNKHPESVESCP